MKSNGDAEEIKGYEERIRGLTLLNNELFVTIERRNTVEVFDSSSKRRKKKITFTGLTEPGTMASCTTNNCIYVIDKKLTRYRAEIFKFNPGEKSASKWLTGFYGRLSVTTAGNVVLAAYMRDKKHMLKIYSTEGRPLETIDLSTNTDIDYLWHAVELKQGDFVVSHGCTFEESFLHRVCIVRQDGKEVKKSFGGERGPSINELNEPSYLAVTAEGSILVTDMQNHRVLLLSNDLKLKKQFCTQKIHLPENMYFDEENNQLFVGCNLKIDGDGRLLCFPFTIQ